MRVSVDSSRCQGHGRCYATAPNLFDPIDDDGHSEAVVDHISSDEAELIEAARRAVEDCPEMAVTIEH